MSVNSNAIDAQQQKLVEKATVRILRANRPVAQGVLVPGGYILTAAHCIKCVGDGRMAMGEEYTETIQASDDTKYKVSPCAIELLTDIAVLEAVDDQRQTEEHIRFQKFRWATEPVPVSEDDFRQIDNDPLVRVHILTHKGEWKIGSAGPFFPLRPGSVGVRFDTKIESGTSGSPVIDDNGLLVGVISHSSENPEGCNGMMPRPHLALPVWVWNRIKKGE